MRTLLIFLVVLGVLFFARNVIAQTAAPQEGQKLNKPVLRYRYSVQETLRQTQSMQPRCPGCDLFVAGRSGEEDSKSCRQTYRDLYHVKDRIEDETASDKIVDMRVAFGYMDAGKETDDFYAAFGFTTALLDRCSAGQFACGFKQHPDDPEFLMKTIQMMGPDGKLRTRHIRLQVKHSSVTNSETKNRGEAKAIQESRTEEMNEFFAEGLNKADVLLYVGHARNGGGPDFGPPVVNAKTRKTDFPWYQKNKPGLGRMEEALANAKKTPRILGLLACYAEDHFPEFLRKNAPKSGLVLAGEAEFQSITGQAMATIDSTLGLRCERAFGEAVNVIKRVEQAGLDVTPVKIENVFRK